jgi:uncharacterized protein YbaA (DUF1428 family)
MSYVDGFLLVVPKKNKAAYRKMALEGARTWMKYGALDYFECIGNDLKAEAMGDMKTWSFTDVVKAKKNEEVWFSFIVYKSKKHRDQVNKKVMAEMNEQASKYQDLVVPFDMQRMAKGGFEVVVEKHKRKK